MKQMIATIETPTNEKRLTLKDRITAAKTAYLSIPSAIGQSREAELLKQARRRFSHLRIGIFAGEFESRRDWRKNFNSFVTDVDCLIVAVDSTRLIGLGVAREINAAKRAGKVIILFDVERNGQALYYGYEKIETEGKPAVRLRERCETLRKAA
ncbi:MAG TPA: hypothetical protein VJ810_23710 [Blastocatellia bacterium]|nr:hypothetical protein [Blastocatellia bacterium]